MVGDPFARDNASSVHRMALDAFYVSSGKSRLLARAQQVSRFFRSPPPGDIAMTERREGHFQGHKGAELFFQTWTRPDAHGTLVITHGIAEHSDCYHKTAERLVAKGWNVCAWDLRGHGRSEGKRGFVEDFRFFSQDLALLVRFLKQSGKLKEPFALLGHSMGGLITLRAVVDAAVDSKSGDEAHPLGAAALTLSSPLLGFGLEVPVVKDFAARLLNRVLPSVTLYNEIRYEDLTRDQDELQSYPLDPLRHDKISPPIYLGMIEGMAYVKAHADRIKLPTLIMAAGQEKIVSRPAIEEFFPKVGATEKKLIVYDSSYHEILNDLDRDQVLKDLDAFLQKELK
jgi:alpha-beta hydrolase superfamily lysophospholipase